MDDDLPLVAYGESIGPPLRWPRKPLGEARDQCDDDCVLDLARAETAGLDYDTDGEAIGDFG